MKNLVKLFGTRSHRFCAVTLAAVIGFSFAACNNGTTGAGGLPPGPLVISGTLGGGSPSIVPAFSLGGPSRATGPTAATQTFRVELGSDNKTLSGKLKDGSLIFELSGIYDASTKVFSMQAPSSIAIFSIVGKLNAANSIDTGSTKASLKVKDGDEWIGIDLTVTPSNQTVNETVTESGGPSIPVYCRGTFTDQISALRGWSRKYYVTKNSITMYDGENPPEDLTVVDTTNVSGGPADEIGPWHLIIQATYTPYGGSPIPHIEKFYVSKTFDAKLTSDIGNTPVKDVLYQPTGDSTLLKDLPLFSGIKMVVVPVCGIGANISTAGGEIFPDDGNSPLFIGTSATTNAKATNTLKAKSGFMVALK